MQFQGAVIKNVFIKVSKKFTVQVEIHALGYDNWYQDAVHNEEITSAVIERAKERIYMEEELKKKKRKKRRWEDRSGANSNSNLAVAQFYEVQHISGKTLRLIHCFEKRSTSKVHLLITDFGKKKSSVCKDHMVFKEKMIVKAYPLDRYHRVQKAVEQEAQTSVPEDIVLTSKPLSAVSSYFNDCKQPIINNIDQQESLKAILKKQRQNKKLKRHNKLCTNDNSDASTTTSSTASTDYNSIREKYNLVEDEHATYGNFKVITIKSNTANNKCTKMDKIPPGQENKSSDCYNKESVYNGDSETDIVTIDENDQNSSITNITRTKHSNKELNSVFDDQLQVRSEQLNLTHDVYEFDSSPDDLSDELPSIKRKRRCVSKSYNEVKKRNTEKTKAVSKKYGRAAQLHELASNIVNDNFDINDFDDTEDTSYNSKNCQNDIKERKDSVLHSASFVMNSSSKTDANMKPCESKKLLLCYTDDNDIGGSKHLTLGSENGQDDNIKRVESIDPSTSLLAVTPRKTTVSLKTNKSKKLLLSVSSESEEDEIRSEDRDRLFQHTKTVFDKSVLSNCDSKIIDFSESNNRENVLTYENNSSVTHIKREDSNTFLSGHGNSNGSENTNNTVTKLDVDQTCMEIEDILSDCFILDEFSTEFPRASEDDSFEKEIKNVRDVQDLTDEQVEYLVKKNEIYLRNIFQGKSFCRRHQDYKKGGTSRVDLTYQVKLGIITEDQQDVVMESLIKMFCKRHHKYLDYIMKVMLPEILIKIYMDIHGVTHAETEEHLLAV